MILTASFFLAFCSLGYNFIFSNLLAISLGATIAQYCIGLGLYVFSLGLGSIAFDHLPFKKNFKLLMYIEALICLAAFGGSFFIILNDFTARHLLLSEVKLLSYLPTIILGFLSGMELPLLLSYSKYKQARLIIAADYFGMMIMCICFGFFLVPYLGFFRSLQFCLTINILVILGMGLQNKAFSLVKSFTALSVLLLLLILPPWENWLKQLFLA